MHPLRVDKRLAKPAEAFQHTIQGMTGVQPLATPAAKHEIHISGSQFVIEREHCFGGWRSGLQGCKIHRKHQG